MAKRYGWWPLLGILVAVFVWGCEMGQVDQGRVVGFDPDKREATIIRDLNYEDPLRPDYSHLPPLVYKVPTDPHEMGPLPDVGYRLKIDLEKREIKIFDPATQDFKFVPFTPIDVQENVRRDDPRVRDKDWPVIDQEKRTITVYSARQRLLITFTVEDNYFELPAKTWQYGDEVRIYYKEPGQALRFMNINTTDIFRK
jgi:hypothetical protein